MPIIYVSHIKNKTSNYAMLLMSVMMLWCKCYVTSNGMQNVYINQNTSKLEKWLSLDSLLFQPGSVVMVWFQCHGASNTCNIIQIIYKGHASKSDKHISLYSLLCLHSFKTIYKMVYCVEQETNMCIFHIYATSFRSIYGVLCVYVSSIIHVTAVTVHILHKLHFMLVVYITEQIWLLHYKYRSSLWQDHALDDDNAMC